MLQFTGKRGNVSHNLSNKTEHFFYYDGKLITTLAHSYLPNKAVLYSITNWNNWEQIIV